MKALKNINVLDLSNFLPGPFCSMLLSEEGADVIKIEDTLSGDPLRNLPPFYSYENALSLLVNKDKKSVQVNLKSDEGIKIIKKLVKKADVIIESFRPGRMKKMGLSYDELKTINPSLIYCSISGFGQKSKLTAGHDINFLSLSGFLGQNDALPPTQIGDLAGAMYTAHKIALALLYKEKTKKGTYLDISLTDATIGLMSPVLMEYLAAKKNKKRFKKQRPLTGQFPCYNIYETKDKKKIALGALETSFWSDFCKYFDVPELLEKQFSTNRKVFEKIQKLIAKKTFKEYEKIAEETSFCLTPVYDVTNVFDSHYMRSTGIMKKMKHPTEGTVDVISRNTSTPSPRLGEHTKQVLKKVGYSDEDLVRLKGEGVINYFK